VASRPKAPSRPGGKRGGQEEDIPSRQRALYALPLGEFTRARDALAQELKAKGQAKQAQETRQLKRPVVTAWVVNQLAQRSPEKLEALLAAARGLESAHRKALSGLGPEALKEANRTFQQALEALMAEAHKTMAAQGRAVTGELFRQAEETLRAAALGTEEDRATLSQGMLTQPLQQSGLGAFSPLTLIGPSTRERQAERRVQERPSARRTARPALETVPSPRPSPAGVVLKGPWAPRREEAPAPPPEEAPSKRQLREEHAARSKHQRDEELHQRRREAQQQALEAQARLKRTQELQQRRREARQHFERVERAERSASLEVARMQAALKAAEVKTLRMRQAFEQAQEAERERAEAVARARAQAETSQQALEQARRELRELEASLAELT
jgi:hypothetical protein